MHGEGRNQPVHPLDREAAVVRTHAIEEVQMRKIITLAAAIALVSTGPAFATGNANQARIARAFNKLGMKPDDSQCYGRIISSRLSPELSGKAAKILETSKNGGEVRKKVNEVGGKVRGAFMSAKANCGI
jgi:hypothetical protein